MAEHEIREANDDWIQSWAQVGTCDEGARLMIALFSSFRIGATSD